MKNADVPNLAVLVLWVAWFAALLALWSAAGAGARAAMLLAGLPVHFWSYAVLHNHMHVAIVRPRALRFWVSRLLGLACGFPYRGFHLHHFNHHRFDNGPGDWGRPRERESALGYVLRSTATPWLMPWRIVPQVWRAARGTQRAEFVLDMIVVDGTVLALIALRPSLGLGWFAMLLCGQALIYWLNLAAHAGSDHADPARLAVTSTSRAYNVLFFNAGYHHAHHARPQAPWRELPALARGELVSPLSPVHPAWVAEVAGKMASCARPRQSTSSSPTPSAVS